MLARGPIGTTTSAMMCPQRHWLQINGDDMKFWGHGFRKSGSVERICMACGYVVPGTDRTTEQQIKEWIKYEEGCELHCGGEWHQFKRVSPSIPSKEHS